MSAHSAAARVTAAVLDGVLEAAVIAFGVYTLLYEVALFGHLSAWPVTAVWVPVALGVLLWRVLASVAAARRTTDTPASEAPAATEQTPARGSSDRLVRAAGLALVAVAVVLAVLDVTRFFRPMWLAATLGAALLLWTARRRSADEAGSPGEVGPEPSSWVEHLVVVLTGLATGTLSLFLLHYSPDDVYYVNRTTWVAEHGSVPLRDTMYGPLTHEVPYNGGLPVASFETLLGGLAHLVHVSGMTMTYLVFPPVGTFLMVWATWMLARAWAPRRPLLAWAGAVAFVLMSTADIIGGFSLPRMWQGKVPALVVVLPLIWVYATRWLERRDRWSLFMLFACGVAFTGLTSTGILLAPVVGAAVVLAGLLRRDLVRSVVGAVALGAFPVVMGVVVVLAPTKVGGADPFTRTPLRAFTTVLGHEGLMVALALGATAAAALLARRGVAAALAGSSALAALSTLAPGVMPLVNDLTGSGPVAWRLLLVTPIALLVGLVLTVRVPRGQAAASLAVLVAFTAVLVLFGRPPWTSPHGHRAAIRDHPVLKVPSRSLSEVRAALRIPHGDGPVLMPPVAMGVISISTTQDFAVDPRSLYTAYLEGYPQEAQDRLFLSRFVVREAPHPKADRVAAALGRLHVSLACLPGSARTAIRTVERAGYRVAGDAAGLTCLTPREGRAPAR